MIKKIELNLDDILGYALSALNYLKYENTDKDEIIGYLESVPELVQDIHEILAEIERKIENE